MPTHLEWDRHPEEPERGQINLGGHTVLKTGTGWPLT